MSKFEVMFAPSCLKVLPNAGMALAVPLLMSEPAMTILTVLPPRSPAVPRSSVPPVTLKATWLKPEDSSMSAWRMVSEPPLTRTVGSSVAVVNVPPFTVTTPEMIVRAGEAPVMTTPPAVQSNVRFLLMTTPA